MKGIYLKSLIILTTMIFSAINSHACTNFLVSRGASADSSVMVTYNADAGVFMEPLFYLPAADHEPGDSIKVFDWDTGKYLGNIAQVEHTYRVIGNMNEHQVAIGETTFTGRKELRDTNGIIDYGSLMRLALQRAKTAREAIKVMTDLVAEYGYYSTGESFSIADKDEVWIMEMIGKGGKEKGAVWVARRVPDGYISAHANQARIRDIPMDDPENCLYSEDVIEFAEEMGYFDPAEDGEFSFADIYCPLDPGGALYCEGRVWSLFTHAAPSLDLPADYWRAVKGAEPYPLFIKPDKKLSVEMVIDFMRDHFEGTPYDMTKGLAAGAYGCPYRWKPLQWQISDDTTKNYGWGRPISTQQTAFAFVSQSRNYLPDEIGGIFWYGVDDNYSNVYMPLYVSLQRPPKSLAKGSIKEFSFESAFWVFNLVSNRAYTKYSYIIEDIQKVQKEIEGNFHSNQAGIEKAAMEYYKQDKQKAIEFLSNYSISQVEYTVDRWLDLWKFIVVKYNDGYINDVQIKNGRAPKSSGYGDEFYKKAIKERPGYFDVEWKEEEIYK